MSVTATTAKEPRRVATRMVVVNQPWQYFKVSIIATSTAKSGRDTSDSVQLNVVQVRSLLAQQCQQLFGQVGSGLPVDVLRYDPDSAQAILRVPSDDAGAFWSALSLASPQQMGGTHRVSVQVLATSASLVALASSSRDSVSARLS